MLHTAWNSKGEMPYRFPRSSVKFQGHTVQNITDFDPNWAFPDYRPVAAFKSLRFALFNRKEASLFSSSECRIRKLGSLRHQIASSLNVHSQTDRAIEGQTKPWTQQSVPMMSEHSAHLTSLPIGFRTWLWRYACLLLLILMWQAIFESKGDN